MTKTDLDNYIKTIKLIHLALIAGPAIFLFISIFLRLTENWNGSLNVYSYQVFIAMLVVCASAIVISRDNFYKGLARLKNNAKSPEENLEKYRGILIKSWAILEFAELLSIVLFLLTGSYDLLFLIIGLLIYSYLLRPVSSKISSNLGIEII
ncbi:MAG: hypothetical protein ABI266_08730 [Ginsengibacter sp.]